MTNRKAQTALEYLTTYGWAILITAVVLGSLYSLGLFNSQTYASKAISGACQVYRPSGSTSTLDVTLQGVCNSEEPKLVPYFNGASSHMNITNQNILQPTNQITIGMWIYPTNALPATQYVATTSTQSVATGYSFPVTSSGWSTISFSLYICSTSCSPGSSVAMTTGFSGNLNKWTYVAATYNGAVLTMYVNGASVDTATFNGYLDMNSNNLTIGYEPGTTYNFAGSVADVQIYNTSLGANEIKQLYISGIGGVPSNLQYLVGWWPLNGDVNDYSGNGNNGVANSLYFSGSWYSNYAPP